MSIKSCQFHLLDNSNLSGSAQQTTSSFIQIILIPFFLAKGDLVESLQLGKIMQSALLFALAFLPSICELWSLCLLIRVEEEVCGLEISYITGIYKSWFHTLRTWLNLRASSFLDCEVMSLLRTLNTGWPLPAFPVVYFPLILGMFLYFEHHCAEACSSWGELLLEELNVAHI